MKNQQNTSALEELTRCTRAELGIIKLHYIFGIIPLKLAEYGRGIMTLPFTSSRMLKCHEFYLRRYSQ
jgi:hypothetical protein